MAQTLKWIATEFGGLDVLDFVEEEVPVPGPGQVVIQVHAAGMNPVDYKSFAAGPDTDPARLPLPVGLEVAGVLAALGPDTVVHTGNAQLGDAVLAWPVTGGYSSYVLADAENVFEKPAAMDFPDAANLLLAAGTAAELIAVSGATEGDTVIVHGASGAVGVSVLQQARQRGIRVIGTADPLRFPTVRRFGGEPVEYGRGLEERLRAAAPAEGYVAALDTVGTDEAIDVSLALLEDATRVITIAAFGRVSDGILAIGGAQPESTAFRMAARDGLVQAAARGEIVVPVARTFPLEDAREALELLKSGHPGGKLALTPAM